MLRSKYEQQIGALELDALDEFSAYPTARAFFASVRRAVGELEVVERVIVGEIEPRYGGNGGGSGHSGVSNPTESTVIREVTAQERAAERRPELEDRIGAGLAAVYAVRRGLGDRYADVLDRYYIDRATWADVAEEMDVSRDTAQRTRDVACDWLDSTARAEMARLIEVPAS